MPLRRGVPLKFSPSGVTDSLDATNAPSGSMRQLANLVPSPSTNMMFTCRPAAFPIFDFATAGFSSPGFVSSLLVVGNIAYGTIATSRNPGDDEPFCVNLITQTAITVSGITSSNVPASPPTSGAWTPPIIAQVGSRIIVTHPGFPGGAIKFGWFDVSGFSQARLADTSSSTILRGNFPIIGVQPGMTITGSGIPAGRTVVSTSDFVLQTTGTVGLTTSLTGVGNTAGLAVGQQIAGANIPVGTTIAALPGGSTVTMSQAGTGSATGEQVTFTGTTITMSGNATATADGVSITIAGGTMSSPLWGAGDTDMNPLPVKPVGVAQFYGRAYYALGLDGIVYSDSGFPTRVSNQTAVQALLPSNGLPVTAVASQMLSAPLVSTGIVQALVAFQNVSAMLQITGDQALGNLAMNALPVATGTASPLSIIATELGTAFASPEGVRVVQFNGQVSPPIGDAGRGVTVPWIFSETPSRVCGAAASHTLRMTAQNGSVPGLPWEEWWWDVGRKIWSGPMSLIPSLIQPWQGGDNQNTFIVTPQGVLAELWQADSVPSTTSSYAENGEQMTWAFQTTPLPDPGDASMKAMIEMSFAGAFPPPLQATVEASDIDGSSDHTTVVPINQSPETPPYWGVAVWGISTWTGASAGFQQFPVYWSGPVVFKQAVITLSGPSDGAVQLGNIYLIYERTGYMLPVPVGMA